MSREEEGRGEGGAKLYYSKDFEWEHLQHQIETDPSLQYHFLPFSTTTTATTNTVNNINENTEAWDKFHSRHSTGKFFKERRYLLKEFPELASCKEFSKVLEIGCGNGSTALPILRRKEGITVYASDCSHEALERAKQIIHDSNLNSTTHSFHPFLCDFTASQFPNWLACNSCRDSKNTNKETSCCVGGVDFITLIFTLSAVPLHKMGKAVTECFNVVKPGGLVLFRDYGLYDMTMLRFEAEQRVGDREYVRCDGTRSYFFSLESVRELFCGVGFIELELEYCCVKSVNRRNGKVMRRVWVHGKFQKPTC